MNIPPMSSYKNFLPEAEYKGESLISGQDLMMLIISGLKGRCFAWAKREGERIPNYVFQIEKIEDGRITTIAWYRKKDNTYYSEIDKSRYDRSRSEPRFVKQLQAGYFSLVEMNVLKQQDNDYEFNT